MYICQSCSTISDKVEVEQSMGNCPHCGRNSLKEFEFTCPQCGKDMGEPTQVDMTRIGWGCSNCRIKVYKETE